jgi:hypothetical protein
VDLGHNDHGLTLSPEGRDVLDSHSLQRAGESAQFFHAGVSRSREIDHDSNLYATFRQEEARLRDEHPDLEIRRIILEKDLKREYQEFLQEPNRDRPDTDGRPGRDENEVRDWAREHDCRTSMITFISPTTESSTRSMAGSFTKTSNCSRRTTAALTPSAAPRPAFASTWSPLAVVVVAPGRVRAGWRSSYDARIPSE